MTRTADLESGDLIAALRRYVRRRVAAEASDDVLGEILLRLVRHRGDLESARNPLAWMYRVAASVVADHHRHRAATARVIAGHEAPAERPHDDDAGADAGSELARCLVPMIRDLPAPYADALLLTDIGGVTQKDAAARLGLTVSGMKSRVQRGRRMLREAVLRCCEVRTDRRGAVAEYAARTDRARGCERCAGDPPGGSGD